ncbi:membrane protein [Candidatus Rhodobacter oscarellae]|nr:membrane protein [Candidatus Rhodobacter lobularis]
MTNTRRIAFAYFFVLTIVAGLNYIPGLTDADGLAFGIFALDIFDDALHLASALWALAAALISHRAARLYMLIFGALYLADGAMGLAVGSGYLDMGIFTNGVLELPFGFKILANLPHIGLGGIALAVGLFLDRDER